MARTNVATQRVVASGLNPTLTAVTVDGDVVDAGAVFLEVNNAGGVSVNVTVDATYTQDGLTLPDSVTAIPAGQRRLIGPLPARSYAQASGADAGRVYVNYSVQASVTRAAISL